MAIAVQSTATTGYTSAVNSINITKPTGLAENDLMVALIGYVDAAGATTPSGWTELYDSNNLACFYKIADASDAAASNFTFALDDLGNIGGALFRIDGHDANNPIFDHHLGQDLTVSTSFTITHTLEDAAIANHLLLMHVAASDDTDAQPDVSAPTVTGGTSPTFTQAQEFEDGAIDYEWTSWYATKTDATQITAFGATMDNPGSDGDSNAWAALLILRPQTSATGTHTQLNGTGTLSTNVSSDTTPTTAQLNATGTLNVTSGDAVNPTVWTTTTKS